MASVTEIADPPELRKGLRPRHLRMIAIGGVIGAGLFVGSGAVINDVPAQGAYRYYSYYLSGYEIDEEQEQERAGAKS